MAFPSSPIDGQIYNNYTYNSARNSWDRVLDKKSVKPNDENLIAHYSLDEENGVGGAVATYHLDGNALDMSGHGNHGTETDITYDDGIAVFNGSTSKIEVPKPNIMNTWADSISISAWVYIPSSYTWDTDSYDSLVSCGSYANSFGLFRGTTEDSVMMFARGDSTNTSAIAYIERDTWEHIVGIYTNDIVTTYHNGIEIESHTITLDGSPPTDVLTLGGGTVGSGTGLVYYEGRINEVNIFDRALSADEVLELYNNPSNKNLNPPTLPTSGLIGEWNLNGSSKDTSGNGNDGTDTDMVYSQGRKDNQAGVFNGTTSYTSVPLVFTVNIDKLSISGNFISSDTGARQYIFETTTDYTLTFFIDIDATLSWGIKTNSGQILLTSTNTISFDIWHAFTVRYCRSLQILDLYIDGVKWAGSTPTFYDDDLVANTTINIGTWNGASDRFFSGKQENIKVYNTLLTEQEILALAEQTNPIKDETGNNDGYSIGQLSSVKGINGRGILTDGIRTYGKLPVSSQLIPASDFSMSFWTNTENYGAYFSTMDDSLQERGEINFSIIDGTIHFTYWTGDNVSVEANAFNIPLGEHNCVIVVNDGGTMDLYVDSILKASNTTPSMAVQDSNLVFGYNGYSGYNKSFIDEVRIYDKALSQEEIRYLYEEKI